MVAHAPDRVVSLRHLPSWALLAFAAGAVNAGALLACSRYVSHVTGTLTRVGVDATDVLGLDYLFVLASFMAGAVAAILLVRRPTAAGVPRYWIPLSIVSLTITLVALLGHAGVFGPFGGSVETAHDFAFLCVLGFAMGMQNAAVAASTGMAVRTTHMTGPATDFAVALATLATGDAEERAGAKKSLALRGTKLIAFILGGAVMPALCVHFGFLALVLPAAACVAATLASFVPFELSKPLRAES